MIEQGDMLGMPADAESLIGRDLGDVQEGKWARLLANLVDVLADLYRRKGFDETRASALARDSVLTIAEYHGGRMTYLPRGDQLKRALRDAEIFARANATNILALAKEFEMTDRQIYRIISQQQALHISKVQGRFSFE